MAEPESEYENAALRRAVDHLGDALRALSEAAFELQAVNGSDEECARLRKVSEDLRDMGGGLWADSRAFTAPTE